MKITKVSAQFVLLNLFGLLVIGCQGGSGTGLLGGDPGFGKVELTDSLGATPGGAQDIAYARKLIEQGQVPNSSAYLIEGLLSEHDLSIDDEKPCESLMCAQGASAIAPMLGDDKQYAWVQLGMKSSLSAEEFIRPALDLVVMLDRSQSMSIDMQETNEALVNVINNLTERDRLALYAFNSEIEVLHEFGHVTDKAALITRLRSVRAKGSWDFQKGIEAGEDMLSKIENDPARMQRLLIMSCSTPEVSASHEDNFSARVLQLARRKVGTSFVGVLAGYSQNLAKLLGDAHGGTYSYINNLEKVEKLFRTDFDLMMTPLAYDFEVKLRLADGIKLDRLIGLPGEEKGSEAGFKVSTLFLSRGGGAILARLELPKDDIDSLGSINLQYDPEPALGIKGSEFSQELVLKGVSGDESNFSSQSIRIAVALVNEIESLKSATDAFFAKKNDDAIEILAQLERHLRSESIILSNEGLLNEADMVKKLIQNMQKDEVEVPNLESPVLVSSKSFFAG